MHNDGDDGGDVAGLAEPTTDTTRAGPGAISPPAAGDDAFPSDNDITPADTEA